MNDAEEQRFTTKDQRDAAEDRLPAVLMVMLCMHCTLGGAEKQYARAFEMLAGRPGSRSRLLITRSLLELLQSSGLLLGCEDHLTVLDPPFRRGLHRRGSRSRLLQPAAFLLDVLWYSGQCWQAIRRHAPDVVHPLLTGVYLVLPALLLQPNLRLLMSAYSYQFVSYRDRRLLGIPVGASLKRFAMGRARAIDALTGPIRDELIARGLPTENIYTPPNPFTDFSRCNPAPRREPWVVFLGRFVAIKNPLLLAQAIPQVLARHPQARFYFLGSGELEEEIASAVQSLGVADRVTIGFAPDPAEVLNRSSIFVSLQSEENYPSQSLLEAMTCGNAVVATDVGETWRLVDGSTGVRVPAAAEAVAGAIIRLLDREDLPELGANARLRILKDFPPEAYFRYLRGLYRLAASDEEPLKP